MRGARMGARRQRRRGREKGGKRDTPSSRFVNIFSLTKGVNWLNWHVHAALQFALQFGFSFKVMYEFDPWNGLYCAFKTRQT